jgi:hypothetical protein
MATRLYPSTTNETSIEILAGVPAGTTVELNAIKAKFEGRPHDDFLDAIYSLSGDVPLPVARLHNFQMFGWGRVNYGALTALGFDGEGDSTKDPAMVRLILSTHEIDVDPALVEGLNWN